MSTPIQEPKKSGNSLLQRLPRLSTTVWILIIVCLFLIAAVPLAMGYLEQFALQQALKLQVSQRQTEYDALQAKMASQPSQATQMEKLKTEAEAAKLLYKNIADNSEITQAILDLAWDPDIDITVTSIGVATSTSKILDKEYPVLVYTLTLTGQVTGFQKFLIAIGKALPSSQYTAINITPTAIEGELDSATMTIQVYCNNLDG